MRAVEAPCPACGVFSSRVKDRPLRRIKDLPASGRAVELWWRKRRLVCGEVLCPQRSFTQASRAILPRARLTERLWDKLARAIAAGNRAVSEVAAEFEVLADRAQGAGCCRREVVARAGADQSARDR